MSAAYDLETSHIGKSWIPNKTLAKRALRAHERATCGKCRSGRYYWKFYACHFGGTDHYHVGHKPVNGWARLRDDQPS